MFYDFQIKSKLVLGLIPVLVILSACTGETKSPHPTAGRVLIDGSSTVYPISNAIAKEFIKTKEGEKIDVDVKFSGTSGGFKKFCAGETDISNASRPISIEEMDACVKGVVPFVELPIAFDALTIAVNPQNTWAKQISTDELKKLWEKAAEGKITRWNQIRPEYPDRPITLFGAGSDSGTYDYFNEVIMGDTDNTRSDYTGSEDDNVLVEGISQDPGALGYIPFFYYEANQSKLRALPIVGQSGVAVLPSSEGVQKSRYQPLSRPLFIYVNIKNAQDKPELQNFVEFYIKNGGSVVKSVGYIPLPDEGYRLAQVQFFTGQVGTAFKGVPEPNVTIQEVLRRQVIFQESNPKTSQQK